MKELKDYLHLYLGCRIKSKGGNFGDLVSVSNDGMSIVVYDKDKIHDPRGLCVNSDWLLPILRPLSDMTGEEREEIKNVLPLGKKHDLHFFEDIKDAAKVFSWLLSKHFDLFGLIESGLAIDKTTKRF